MTIPLITAIPSPAPTTEDPDDFDARADALLGALPTMVDEENAAITEMNAVLATFFDSATTAIAASASAILNTAYAATSNTSLSLAAATEDVVLVQSGKAFAAGDQAVLIRRADPEARMYCVANSVSGTTLNVTVPSNGIVGSGGPFTDWIVLLAVWASPGASAADVMAGLSTLLSVTPASLRGAMVPQTLTDAATIAWNANLGANAKVTITADRTVGAPTNLSDGMEISLLAIQGASGNHKLTWNAIFDWGASSPPFLSTTAGETDQFSGTYYAATSKIHMRSAWGGETSRGAAPDVIIQDQKTSGTAAQTNPGAAYVTRDLNTVLRNLVGASLASNQVTLPAGTWLLRALAPGGQVGPHRIKLRNVTDSVDVGLGTSSAGPTSALVTTSEVVAVWAIATAKVVSVQHYSNGGQLGGAASSGDAEVYTSFEATRIG